MADVFATNDNDTNIRHEVTPRVARLGETLWVDLKLGIDQVLSILKETYACHPLVLDHVSSGVERPRISTYDGWNYLAFSAVNTGPDGLCFIHVIFNSRTVVTIHDGSPVSIAEVKRRLLSPGGASLLSQGAGFFIYTLLDEVTDVRISHLDVLQDEIDDLEDEIMLKPHYRLHEAVMVMRRKFQRERRLASAEREIVNTMLRPEFPHMGHELDRYLLDLYYHVGRVLEITDTQREHLMALAEMLMAVTAQRTNDIMKLLTVVSTIFMPLTLITGLYGMNFVFMPELNWRWGYPLVLAAMTLITLLMLKVFRRKKWL